MLPCCHLHACGMEEGCSQIQCLSKWHKLSSKKIGSNPCNETNSVPSHGSGFIFLLQLHERLTFRAKQALHSEGLSYINPQRKTLDLTLSIGKTTAGASSYQCLDASDETVRVLWRLPCCWNHFCPASMTGIQRLLVDDLSCFPLTALQEGTTAWSAVCGSKWSNSNQNQQTTWQAIQ